MDCQTVGSNELASCKEAESCNKASTIRNSKDLGCSGYSVRRSSRLNSKREMSWLQNVDQCVGSGFKRKVVDPQKVGAERETLSFTRDVKVSNMSLTQQRNVNNRACPTDCAFASSVKCSRSVPSFQFCSRSEEGINLLVDLNSSPSDWCKMLDMEMCICRHLEKNKFPSFRKELELLGSSDKRMKSLIICNTDSDTKMNGGHLETDSSPDLVMRADSHAEFTKLNGDDGSLEISATQTCSISTKMTENSEEENESLLSPKLNSDVSNLIVSGIKSFPRDKKTKTVGSNVVDTHHVHLGCDFVVDSALACPDSINTLDDQNSSLVDKNCGDIDMQNTCNHMYSSAVASVGSMEMQLSEVVNHQKDVSRFSSRNNSFPTFMERVQNVEIGEKQLANCSAGISDASGNHKPASAEGLERSSSVSGMEASQCLHFSGTIRKRSEGSVSDGRCKRKRHHNESDDDCSQNNARILSSSNQHGGKVLPRRSMRLASKVAAFIGRKNIWTDVDNKSMPLVSLSCIFSLHL